jgi:hypothetical protein
MCVSLPGSKSEGKPNCTLFELRILDSGRPHQIFAISCSQSELLLEEFSVPRDAK